MIGNNDKYVIFQLCHISIKYKIIFIFYLQYLYTETTRIHSNREVYQDPPYNGQCIQSNTLLICNDFIIITLVFGKQHPSHFLEAITNDLTREMY